MEESRERKEGEEAGKRRGRGVYSDHFLPTLYPVSPVGVQRQ